MKKSLYILLFLILLLVSFSAGNRFNQRVMDASVSATGTRQILHYVDPMNPAHTTKEPGIAPCGMPMEPVYADDETVSGWGTAGRPASPGQVRVNPIKQQVIGVQTGEVTKSAETKSIRALGLVAADENLTYTLIAASDGWVGEVHESTTGSLVEKNQLMAQIRILDYDFFTWQRRFLTELDNVGRRRSFYAPSSGADQMLEEIPAERPVDVPQTETGMPAASPHAHSPHEATAGQAPVEAELPTPAGATAIAPTPSPPGTMSPMEAPLSAHGTAAMAGSAKPGAEAQAGDAHTGSPHHNDKAPVLLKKRSPLPEAARRGQARVVVRESDGGLGFSDEEDYFSASRARLELLNLGLGANQLAELSKNRIYIQSAELRSPVRGIVLARNVSPHQKIERNAECFRIADLSRVWVEADVYESEIQHIQPEMEVRVSLPKQGKHFTATVSHTLPRFDGASRSFRVRLEMDNPGLVFRPEMFVDVEFQVPLPESVSVPASAVIDTGKRKTVYAVVGEGLFAPREVLTGWRTSDRVEIVRGLQPGDKIAVSDTFLIDSESRMRLAAAGLMTDQPAQAPTATSQPDTVQPPEPQPAPAQPAPTPPVATQPVAGPDTATPAPPPAPAESPAEPVVSEAAVVPPVPPAQAAAQARDQAAKLIDPVCGMEVDPQQARADGLTLEVAGVTHFFCSEECKQQFQQDPSGSTGAPAGAHAHEPPPGHGKGAHD